MFSHVMLGTNDLEASKTFYDALMAALGHEPKIVEDKPTRRFYFTRTGTFAITTPLDGEPATHGNGSTIGFAADSSEMVDAWHAAGVANGGTTCEEPPGLRESAISKLYLAYLRDPSGNKVCAMYRVVD